MTEYSLEQLAGQLKKPHGEAGKQLGAKMNLTNTGINLLAIQELQVQTGDKILEIGMGNGFFVKNILATAPGATYCGCDFSETMVAEANRINYHFVVSQQAQFVHASAQSLPFAAASFGKVFTVNTIYFWEDPARELAEIKRILKSGGILLIAIRPQAVMETYPFTAYGFKLYSTEELTQLLENNYFKVSQVLEKPEPDQEINGTRVKISALLVIAVSA